MSAVVASRYFSPKQLLKILETEKGYLAEIISSATRMSFKKIKKSLGLKNISLAKPEVVLRETGAQVGSVSLVNLGAWTFVGEESKSRLKCTVQTAYTMQ